jgi:hypothetical protein
MALLHALYKASQASPIASVEWDKETERLRNFDSVGVSHGDAEYWNNFTHYYDEYCTQMLSWDLAFRCCDTYEPGENKYNKDFLNNVVYYMTENSNINVGSFVMMFKAYMA